MLHELLSRFPPVVLERPPASDANAGAEGIWPTEKPALARLHVQGGPEALRLLERLPRRGLGVVGTREPQHRSRALVRKVLAELRGRDLIIVSGFARGIDACAHEAALEHELPTVALLGCGLEIDYPRGHTALRRRILEAGGLVVSEFEPRTAPYAGQFHRRNRLIAAWSQSTWVVEAGFRSGALNTASWAAQHSRQVFATPAFPEDPAFGGNQRLIQHLSAHALFDSRELGEIWPELSSGPVRSRRPASGASAGYARFRDARTRELCRRVTALGKAQGGAQIEPLLDWAITDRGWLPVEFFDALSAALDAGWLRDSDGTLVAEPDGNSPVTAGALPPAL